MEYRLLSHAPVTFFSLFFCYAFLPFFVLFLWYKKAMSRSQTEAATRPFSRVQKFRTAAALQRFLEHQLYLLSQKELLEPGQKGYVDGADTKNPDYIAMTSRERMKMRITLVKELRTCIDIDALERQVEELEVQLGEIIQLINTNAPYLLQGENNGPNPVH